MLAPFASEQLVVLLLDRCHCRLEGLLVEANPDQHSEVGRVEVGVCQHRRGARLHAVSDLKVKHRAQVLQSSTVHRYSVAFSSAVMRPSQNDPRNLTCVPIRFIGAAEAACIFALLVEAGPSSSLVAYAKRWSRNSGRSSLRERVLGRDRLASSIHGLEYKYSRMRQTYS